MSGSDPFSPDPIILDQRESEYTGGELHALLAPVLGLDAEQIKSLAIVADTDMGIAFGGSRGQDDAKELLVSAIISGILNA
jgi:hypothetical protein